MLTLYYAAATCALASHIALEEAKADYTLARLDFASNQQRSPEYLKLNPKGRVPALVTPQGVLTETPAILIYIAQTHPDAGLAPLDDAFQLARVNEFNSYLCATVHIAHAHKRRGARWADDPAAIEAMQKRVPKSMTEVVEPIEHGFLKGPWVLGERFSVSDLYLFTISQWLEGDGVDVSRFPRVLAHRQRVAERASTQKALATEEAAP